MIPFYDPLRTYEDNYANGPFGAFAGHTGALASTGEGTLAAGGAGADAAADAPGRAVPPSHPFVGHRVRTPFGIPAGPLVNAAFCAAAFAHGFDVNVYKTVRTRAHEVHPFPNTLRVHVEGDLTLERAAHPLLATADFSGVSSISNSFGVPSRDPDVWQPDVAAAIAAAGADQLLIGSFQGTRGGGGDQAYIADHVTAARLMVEAGARALEVNLSCPNEGTSALLCFDAPLVARISAAIKEQVGDVPLILKLAYFASDQALREVVEATAATVDGYAAVNTIPARLVDANGGQALPGEGRAVAGVCGGAIRWAGLDMVERLARLRETRDVAIIGVGGVLTPADYSALRAAGADAVMSATGAMFAPDLGLRVRELAR